MSDDPRPIRRPRRPRKRLRTPNEDVRRRLLEAARDLISEHGMPELRVEEVANRADLSVGTFYLYFEGKNDLFSNLVIEYTSRLQERMRAAYGGSGSLLERLTASLEAYLDFVEENEQGFLHFRDAGSIDTTVGRLSSWALEQHAADLRPLIEEGVKSGEFREMNAEYAAQALVGLIQHMAGWWLENRERCARPDLSTFIITFTGFGMNPRGPQEPGAPG